MKIKLVYQRNVFLLLLLIYFAQGSLYGSGSIISQLSLFVIILIGFIYLTIYIVTKKLMQKFIFVWTLLLILNISGYILTAEYDNANHFSNLKNILFTSLTFYPIYYFSNKDKIGDKNIIAFLILMLPITILQYFYYEKIQFLEYNQDTVVNNITYIFVGLIPFIFFLKKKIYALIILIIIISFLIIGGKRGAAISGIAGIAIYFIYMFNSIKYKSKLYKLLNYSFLLLILIGLIYFVFSFIENDSFLLNRLTSGYASNRDTNYQQIFYHWYESNNFINLLFGFGFASSITMNSEGVLAHNDWLEILSNFGLLGILIYASLLYSLLKKILKTTNLQYKYCLISVLTIWILTSLFSMFYNDLNTFLYSIILAYIFGKTKTEIKLKSDII